MTDLSKWRGLGSLLVDAVEEGSRAVERIQLETAQRPFAVIEQVPVIARFGRVVHVAHTAAVTTVHAGVRLVAHAVGTAVEAALAVAESRPPKR